MALIMVRRLGFIQRRVPSGGSILGAVLGAAVGSLLLKKFLFSRRAPVVSGNVKKRHMRGVAREDFHSMDHAPEQTSTPPHGDVLAKSVDEVAPLQERH